MNDKRNILREDVELMRKRRNILKDKLTERGENQFVEMQARNSRRKQAQFDDRQLLLSITNFL